MNVNNDQLIEELVNTFRNFKKMKFRNDKDCGEFTHNEKMILFILSDISQDNIVSLSVLRERMRLAPSTITPMISVLEKKGLIKRNIDKNDRRNISLQISSKGREFTNRIQAEIRDQMSKYIEYIGEDDTKQLIRLIAKTTEFFKRKGR
jgi:DNA-binding MarR family transcriptional regulator